MSTPWNFAEHLRRPNIRGVSHGVAAGHHLAAQAGLDVLERGGNAVDAGVCAGIVLNVVENQQCSFSGVAPIMIHLAATGQTISLDGLGTWPAAASVGWLRKRGLDHVVGGIEATIVPGAPDAWLTALSAYGTWSFADVVAPAIRYARDGFVMYDGMAHTVKLREPEFPAGTEAHRILFPNGKPPVVGELFYQPDLANSLQYMVDAERASGGSRERGIRAARDAFYKGEIAKAFVDYHQANGGALTMEDMGGYSVTIETPPARDFRGHRVHASGPWSQGPMLLQELAIIDALGIDGTDAGSAEHLHIVLEAIKLAAQDREQYYGDPKFIDVPLDRLISDEHGTELAGRFRPDAAYSFDSLRDARGASNPMMVSTAAQYGDTTHVAAVDQWGNGFSATTSDGIMHLSPVVPGTGMAVSPRGVQSRAVLGHPAVVQAGKRPRLTPNPAMLTGPDGRVMPFGTPGGDLQTQAMLQFLINHVVFEMDLQRAIETPRVYSYDFPDSFPPHGRRPRVVRYEHPMDGDVIAALWRRGHVMEAWPQTEWPLTSVNAVSTDPRLGTIDAASDFRRHAYAVGR